MPDRRTCAEVARWLEWRRQRWHSPGDTGELDPSVARARKHGRALVFALAALSVDALGADVRVPGQAAIEAALRRRAEIAQTCATVRGQVAALLASLEPPRHRRRAWHAEAEGLARLFRWAMEMANPGRRYGMSSDGPLARWVAAALAIIGAEHPSPAAVSQALRRSTRKIISPDRK